MARIGSINRVIVFRVFADDHLPAHFHVIGPDFSALIEIATMQIIRGSIPSQHHRNVMAWAADNREVAAAEWNRLHPKYPV